MLEERLACLRGHFGFGGILDVPPTRLGQPETDCIPNPTLCGSGSCFHSLSGTLRNEEPNDAERKFFTHSETSVWIVCSGSAYLG
jgi:hypothetical protein